MRAFITLTLLSVNFFHAGAAFSEEVTTKEKDACVEVEVDGVRAPSYSCLSEKLNPKTAPQTADGKPPQMASEKIVQRPSNQLDLFNRAATSNRMGNTFGTSVYPQRPANRP